MTTIHQDFEVFILVKIAPWSLSVPARSKVLDSRRAQVQIDPTQFKFEMDDWESLLPIGQQVVLQISHNLENLDAPVVESRIDEWRWIEESNIIHLHITFLNSPQELNELILNFS